MKKKLLSLLLFIMGATGLAQPYNAGKDSLKRHCAAWSENHYLDLSLGAGENIFTSSLQWDKLFAVAWKKRIKIGFGIRTNIATGSQVDYHTAFPERTGVSDFDTLRMGQQTLYSMNLAICMEIALTRWLDIGLNEDLAGFSWGPKAEGSYRSAGFSPPVSPQQAVPELPNLFLFGRNDLGSLNSQFFVRFWPDPNIYIKAGAGILHLSNIAANPLKNGNTRFFSAHTTGFFALGFCPSRSVPVKKKRKIRHLQGTPVF